MSFLENLTNEQKETLVSLPYRVGLLISQSDETGGDEADAQEAQVLANILDGFTHEVFGSEVIQEIMSETVAHKEQWQGWAGKLDNVANDCRVALEVLAEHGEDKDVKAFRNYMMEIGEAVAAAFSEYEHVGFAAKLELYITYYKHKIKAQREKRPIKSLQEFLSISSSERSALSSLAESLGTTYI